MDTIVSSFEAIAGEGAAASYAALTIQAMSKHFSNLRDAIITQLNALSDSLSKDQPKRQKKETLHQLGMIQIRQVWRPLRGLPGESVSLLRSWLFEHFLHPYPTDNEKRMLDSQTGLTRSQVKLWCGCPFWPDDGMCRLRDCSVCECPDSEFPEPFKKPSQALPADDLMCQEGKPEAVVDRTLDSKAFRGWIEVDNPWTYDDETDNDEMTYVNLQLNPERYTGYVGPSARRIWDAVYTENCPKYPSGEFCQEKRVLYKLISGLHSSISVHIASDYLLDEAKNLWGPNLTLLYDRVLQHPDRVRNLYFTFLFVLRAVTKAADYLEQAEYNTGNPVEDLKTQSLVRQLVYNPKLQAACPLPYDEAKLWQGESGPELMQQIQKQFRNISALMDCVGCEKCRLWGKLQVLGLGTALKILFSVNGQGSTNQPLQLQRNEVIALVNLLNRLSESVDFVHKMAPHMDKIMEDQRSLPSSKSFSL